MEHSLRNQRQARYLLRDRNCDYWPIEAFVQSVLLEDHL